jgi:hypothetical protein
MKPNTPHTAGHTTGHITSPFSRRTLLVSMIAAPVLAAVVAACGDDTVDTAEPADSTPDASNPDTSTPDSGSVPPATDAPAAGTIEHPTGADEVVLRYGYDGGFVAPGTLFVNIPMVLVSGDGRVFAPGITTLEYPGPLLYPMTVRTISEAGIQTLLAAADEAGLLATPPDYSADMNVADVQDTVVTLSAGGETFVHSAYALGFGTDDQGNPAPEQTPARAALLDFTTLLGDLSTTVGADQLGPESVFEPTEYRLQAAPVVEADLAGMDPAPTIVEWPASTGLDLATAAECARLSADAAGSVFYDADGGTFFQQGDTLYRISVAGVLPGDAPC